MTIFEVATIFSPLLSLFFAYFAFRRNQKNDDGETAREMGTILTEIGYIKSQIDSVNHKLEHSDERYVQILERVSAAEQSLKSAHHRIDMITEGVNHKNEKN